MISGQLDAAASLDFASHFASITGKTRTLYSIPLSGHIILNFFNHSLACSVQLTFFCGQ